MKTEKLYAKTMATMVQFEKNTSDQLPANSRQFAETLFDSVRKWYKSDVCAVLYTTSELPETVQVVQDRNSTPVLHKTGLREWELLLGGNSTVVLKKNDGHLISKDYTSWVFIPVLAKKKVAAAVIMARAGGRMGSGEEEAGLILSQFFTTALKRIRKTNKRLRTYGDDIRQQVLLEAQASAGLQSVDFPGLARAVDYGSGTGSDFSIVYRPSADSLIACVGDITAVVHERQKAFVFMNAILDYLSGMPLDALQILMKMNESLVRRRSEWYISAVLARYMPQDHHIEIAGGGNAGALHFSHADMNVREYTFGVAAGVDSDAEFFMSRIPVQTGDIVCLFTDGVYCARKRNGDPFGKTDLADTVRKNYFLGADDLARKILEVLREKEDPSVDGDDRTIQVLKIE